MEDVNGNTNIVDIKSKEVKTTLLIGRIGFIFSAVATLLTILSTIFLATMGVSDKEELTSSIAVFMLLLGIAIIISWVIGFITSLSSLVQNIRNHDAFRWEPIVGLVLATITIYLFFFF